MSQNSEVSRSPIKKSCLYDNGGDHISNLHASVISGILSRLSTKEAVQTSVLSKDWKFKWTGLQSFHIDDTIYKVFNDEEQDKFANFVGSVLRHSENIKSFLLISYNRCTPSRLSTWILDVLGRKVERFQVFAYLRPAEEKSIVLPFGLITSNSLRILGLRVPCCLNNIDAKSCFPNLTSMHLCVVQILNRNSDFDKISLTFPVLEILKIQHCTWVGVKFLEIYAPALATFFSQTTSDCYRVRDIWIKVFAPRLAKFESSCLPENIVMDGGSSQVVSALLWSDVGKNDDELFRDVMPQTRKLLAGFSNVEELWLSNFVIEALLSGGRPLQRYYKLRQLSIYCCVNNEQLFELLHAAPRLKYLCVNLCDWDNYEYDWIEPVPACIVSHLEEIKITAFRSEKPQNKFAKFMLEKGGVLKKLSFKGGHTAIEREQIVADLSKFPRLQTSLTIFFPRPDSITVLT